MPHRFNSPNKIMQLHLFALFALLLEFTSLSCTSSVVVVESLTLPSFRRENHIANHAASSAANANNNHWNIETTQLFQNSISNHRNRQQVDNLKLMENGLLPFGPVPRGGSLPDILSLGSGGEATLAARPNNRQRTRSRPLVNSWRNVRSTVRGARRRVVCAVNMSVLREAMSRRADADAADHTNSMNGPSMLRVGGMINRRLLRRGRAIDVMETVDCLDVMGDIDAWGDTTSNTLESSSSTATAVKKSNPLALPVVRRLFQRKASEQEHQQHDIISAAYETASLRTTGSSLSLSSDALSSRGGGGSSAVAINKSSSSSASVIVVDDRNTMSESYYVIETPLFPIILPKSFVPRTAATNSASSVSSTTSLEISVAMEEEVTTTATAKPSTQLLQAATQPLLPKQVLDSFTGREFYYDPESYEALAITGMKMTLCENDHVKWIGEKKTDKFLKEYSANHTAGSTAAATASTTNSNEWYTALDSSQEVLVWAGKFTKSKDDDGYGSELPIIKTTSIIHQSPKYLAELLMDSNMVKVYNKMSLGRTDERVFQTGVDTQGGSFGDGESKVVRNLTKPPMVSSLIEFVTCMHARKLRPSDMEILSPTNVNGSHGDASSEANNEGYIVVSRAVTGDEWSTTNNSNSNGNGEKLVRNEILLGVNILKAVPGEPNKTELTSVTHVYSPMIPLMLAKNAGVKGAVDFVRDIRALP